MVLRSGSALAALILTAGLAGCGGGGADSSEFKSKFLAECQKAPEASGGADCACAADIMDKELDDKSKKVFLIMLDPELQKDPTKGKAALEKAGLNEQDAANMVSKIMPVMQKVEAECKKPA